MEEEEEVERWEGGSLGSLYDNRVANKMAEEERRRRRMGEGWMRMRKTMR